jgi:hypothetical protein
LHCQHVELLAAISVGHVQLIPAPSESLLAEVYFSRRSFSNRDRVIYITLWNRGKQNNVSLQKMTSKFEDGVFGNEVPIFPKQNCLWFCPDQGIFIAVNLSSMKIVDLKTRPL